MDTTENVALIRRLIEACARADPDEFAAYFTDDAVWWNGAVEGDRRTRGDSRDTPSRCRAHDRAALGASLHRDIVADGDVVLTERVDNFLVGDTRVSVPCMGIFQVRDGKIAAWRDYWDLQRIER